MRRACRDEEREQAERVRAEVEAKNAAPEAARRAKMKALKVRNWRIAQAIRKAQEKYKALAAAKAEMDRVVPVTPYAPLGDVEEEERKFIANVNDKQAWRTIFFSPPAASS